MYCYSPFVVYAAKSGELQSLYEGLTVGGYGEGYFSIASVAT
jgi:hypothetical protein